MRGRNSRRLMVRRVVPLALAVILAARTLRAPADTADTYIGPNDGVWSNPLNWSAGSPTPGFDALITGAGDKTVFLDPVFSFPATYDWVSVVTVSNGNSLTFENGGQLETGTLNLTGGTFTLQGTSSVFDYQVLNVSGGGVFIWNSGALDAAESFTPSAAIATNLTLSGGMTLNVNGAVNIPAGTSITVNGGSLTTNSFSEVNLNGGSFTLEGVNSYVFTPVISYSSGPTMTWNSGELATIDFTPSPAIATHLQLSGGMTLAASDAVTLPAGTSLIVNGGSLNTGSVQMVGGGFSLTGASSYAYVGTLTYSSGPTMLWNGGTLETTNFTPSVALATNFNLVSPMTLVVDDTLSIPAGTSVSLNSGYMSAGTLTVSGGAFNWNGGTVAITGAGGLTLGTANFGTSLSMNGRSLVVGNVLSLPAGTSLSLNSGGVRASGIAVSGGSFTQSGGNLSFNTFTQSGGVATLPQFTLGTGGAGAAYNLEGGTLTTPAPTANAGGTFNWTAGVLSITGNLDLPNSALGPTLTLGSSQSLLVGGTLSVNTGASLVAGAGALVSVPSIVLNGGSINQSGGTITASFVLCAGSAPASTGSYVLSGGTLFAAYEYIGEQGTGNFNQTGGTNSVGDLLIAANSSVGTGSYVLSGGTLSAGYYEGIGESGTGTLTQSGGLNTVNGGELIVGNAQTGVGSYVLSGGTLSAVYEYIGNQGAGNFNQTGGMNLVGNLYIAANSTAGTDSYVLSGGTLSAGFEDIGVYDSGTLTQSGGFNNLNGETLIVGDAQTGAGSYVLSGGTLITGTDLIGASGTATFNQSGGIHTVTSELIVGYYYGSHGTYTLSGGTLTAPAEYVSYGGYGTVTQSGGLNLVANTLNVSESGYPSQYTLSGGTLSAGTLGVYGSGQFDWTGGSLSFTNFYQVSGSVSLTGLTLGVGGNGSAYYLEGGTLTLPSAPVNTGGAFNWTGGELNLTGNVDLSTSTLGPTLTLYSAGQSLAVGGTLSIPAGTQFMAFGGSSVLSAQAINLSGGMLTAWGTVTAQNFVESAGSAAVYGSLLVAAGTTSSGASFLLQGGTLFGENILVENGGTFTQTGGTLSFNSINQSGGVVTLLPVILGQGGNGEGFSYSGGALNVSGITINTGGYFNYGGGPLDFSILHWLGGGFNYNGTGSFALSASTLGTNITMGPATYLNVPALVIPAGTSLTLAGGEISTNSITVTGGNFAWQSGDIYVGGYVGYSGSLTPSAANIGSVISLTAGKLLDVVGTLALTAGTTLSLSGGFLSASSLSIAGGSFSWSTGELSVNNVNLATQGIGTNLIIGSGQTLSTDTLTVPAGTGISLSGGAIFATALQITGGTFNWSAGQLEVEAGISLTSSAFGPVLTIASGQSLATSAALSVPTGTTLTLNGGALSVPTLTLSGGTFRWLSGSLTINSFNESYSFSTATFGSVTTLGPGLGLDDAGDNPLLVPAGNTLVLSGGALSAAGLDVLGSFLWTSGSLSLYEDWTPSLTAAGPNVVLTGGMRLYANTAILPAGASITVDSAAKIEDMYVEGGSLSLNGGTLSAYFPDITSGHFAWSSGTLEFLSDYAPSSEDLGAAASIGSQQTLQVDDELDLPAGSTLTLNGGTLSAQTINISGGSLIWNSGGLSFNGFTQTAGFASLQPLTLGPGGNGGSVSFGGGTLSTPTVYLSGGSISQSGGVISVSGTTGGFSGVVAIGYSGGMGGGYDLSGGTLGASDIVVGYYDQGTLQQSGGNITTGYLEVGVFNGSAGQVWLSGGTISASEGLEVGEGGSGSLTQSGGVIQTVSLTLAEESGSGQFTLSGGTLSAGGEQIGNGNGTAVFNQSGGFNTTTSLSVGGGGTASSVYTLSGGSLTASQENVGGAGALAIFNQIGGVNTVTGSGNFTLASDYTTATGEYFLSGGTLSAGTEVVGQYGAGTLVQSGGVNSISGELILAGSPTGMGLYTFSGGTLSTPGIEVNSGGTFNWTGGALVIAGNSLFLGSDNLGANFSLNAGQSLEVDDTLFVPTGTSFTLNGGTLSVGTLTPSAGTFSWSSGELEIESSEFTPAGNNLGANFSLNPGQLLGVSGTFFIPAGTQFTLTGGTLSPANETIGEGGPGTLVQMGGINSVPGILSLGTVSTDAGIYQMRGGALNAGSMTINGGGFNQSAGVVTATSLLSVGDSPGSSGTYQLSGGTLTTFTEFIGNAGSGTFTQSGGVHVNGTDRLHAYELYLGYQAGSSGTYVLSAGTLTVVNGEFVGWDGSGSFTQLGGVNVADILALSVQAGSSGNYNLSGGTLTASTNLDLTDGAGGSATFTQTGGVVSAGILNVAHFESGDVGTYFMSAGTISNTFFDIGGTNASASFLQNGGVASGYLDMGGAGTGHALYSLSGGTLTGIHEILAATVPATATFDQSGGLNTFDPASNDIFTGTLVLGYTADTTGLYQLSGGTLTAIEEVLGYFGGTGFFNQSGGVNTILSQLMISNDSASAGTFMLSGGTLTSPAEFIGYNGPGIFVQSGGINLVSGSLAIGPGAANASYQLSAGSLSAALVNLAAGSFKWTGGNFSFNTFTQTGGVASLSSLTLGAGGIGSLYALQGGTLTVPAAPMVASGGTFNWTSGALVITNNNLSLAANNLGANFSLNVGQGLEVDDTLFIPTGTNFTLNGGTLSVGTLTPSGGTFTWDSGVLSFTGNSSSISAGVLGQNVSLGAGQTLAFTQAVSIPAGTDVTLSGGSLQTGSLVLAGGSFTQTAGNSSLGNVSGSGTLVISGGNALVTAIDVPALVVGGSLQITGNTGGGGSESIKPALGGGGPVASALNALTISGSPGNLTGQVDITDNALIIESTGNKASEISLLQSEVLSGRNSGTWTGEGITSSAVAADVAAGTNLSFHTVVAIVDNGALPAPERFSTFEGQPVDASSIIITRALAGDANLDGTVNNTDLVALLTHFDLSGQTQATGDFNGDGTVNNTDLVALLTDYAQSLPGDFAIKPADDIGGAADSLGGSAPVPEAGTLGVLVAGAAMLLKPRRRKRSFS